MEKALEQIGAIPHVGGSFVCDNNGDVIVSSDPAVLATVTMHTIGREVGRALVALQAADRPATRIDVAYDTWRLLAQDMSDAVLFVICQPEADMARVRMTADVVIAGWRKDSGAQKRLAKHRVVRRELLRESQLDNGSWASWTVIQSRG